MASNDMDWLGSTIAATSYSKNKRKNNEDEEKRHKLDRPGQSSRELNPYWKNGGDGLPSERPEKKNSGIGDGGAGWLRRAYQRAKEQAAEQGRTLEEVAAERWGSLQKLEDMLAKAEGQHSSHSGSRDQHRRDHRSDDRHNRYNRDNRDNRDSRHSGTRWRKEKDSSPRHESRDHRHQRHSSRERTRGHSSDRSFKRTRDHSRDAERRISYEKQTVVQKEPSPPTAVPNVQPETETAEPLTDQEMNQLSAKLLKAEMLGNQTLAEKLKQKLEAARHARSQPKVEVIVVPSSSCEPGRLSSKRAKVETHQKGERLRYFADDDKFTLSEMFLREKNTTSEDTDAEFLRMLGKKAGRGDDLDDAYVEEASKQKHEAKAEARQRYVALEDRKRMNRSVEDCHFCYDGKITKHLVIAVGKHSLLCLPEHEPLVENHCFIVPLSHTSCSTQVDEDVWAEMKQFRQALVRMFATDDDEDCVFLESARYLKYHPHMCIECIPLPRESGDVAPIYFKKAILECETEWAQNKKLVDLRGRGVRNSVPKGLPFFAVDFGGQDGFAHVIEDEKDFPANFGQEIIGGMLDVEPRLWRKPRKENFKEQVKRVSAFTKKWKPFEFNNE